jgi:hypothetical protein
MFGENSIQYAAGTYPFSFRVPAVNKSLCTCTSDLLRERYGGTKLSTVSLEIYSINTIKLSEQIKGEYQSREEFLRQLTKNTTIIGKKLGIFGYIKSQHLDIMSRENKGKQHSRKRFALYIIFRNSI